MIQREAFDWGVRLTLRPFLSGEHSDLLIQSDIGFYKHNRGSDIRITCSAITVATPLRLGDAQVWYEAWNAVMNETRAVVAQMKAEAMAAKKVAPKAAPKAAPKKPPKKKNG